MGIVKSEATSILGNIFKTDNKIALLTELDVSEETFTEVTGSVDTNGYKRYTIQSGEFYIYGGVATSSDNILLGMATGNWGTIVGFAVYSGSSLKYLAELTEAIPIDGSVDPVVPVFRAYNKEKGTGIRVTLDVVEASASA